MSTAPQRCRLCGVHVRSLHGVRVRYRDERGTCHPWPDKRGRWRPEYLCADCAPLWPEWHALDWSGTPAYLPHPHAQEAAPSADGQEVLPEPELCETVAMECSVCGVGAREVVGVFRECEGKLACQKCWDNLACGVLALAESPEQDVRRVAQSLLLRAARLAHSSG